MTGPVVISEWPRNTRECLRVSIDRHQGRPVFAVRVWYRDGELWKPGREGLTLGARHLPPLADALGKALGELKHLGAVSD